MAFTVYSQKKKETTYVLCPKGKDDFISSFLGIIIMKPFLERFSQNLSQEKTNHSYIHSLYFI